MALFNSYKVIAFVGTSQPAIAKAFYGEKLGLTLVSEDQFALVFDANGTMLRVAIVQQVIAAKYTVLGWQVPDIGEAARALQNAGIAMERFQGIIQDELGVWKAPGGTSIAWFKDPDGNTLSISQH